MAALTYFTAKLTYLALSADEATDLDYDPQLKGVNSGVTLTAYVLQPPPRGDDVHVDEIPASALSPTAAMVVLAPVDARLDNGHLCLRAAPDQVIHSYTSQAAFPVTGGTTFLYWDAAADKLFKWNGSAYVEVDNFAPVRLAAQTAVLELPADAVLCYKCEFDHATFAGADRELPSFSFKAATTDIVLDLSTAERAPA